MLYAKKYASVLTDFNAQPLLELSPEKRKHVMKALACLSKYSGCYDKWKAMKERYALKWSNGGDEAALTAFERITSETDNIDSMLAWLKKALEVLSSPPEYSGNNILRFNVLTGLRPSEAIESLKLLKKLTPTADRDKYVKNGFINHFQYPKIFIRRTKKAFISLANNDILALADNIGKKEPSYQAIRMKIIRAGLPFHMEYCRQIYATYLRNCGINKEIIDLLQGRIPNDVFLRHYYRPDFKQECEKVRACLEKLHSEIQC